MRGAVATEGSEVRRWLQIATITLVAAHRSAASRPRGARASRCERRRPTIVYEMIMVARYEVAGSREAVRHLDWPVGSYKRRVARADDAIMRCDDGVDVGSWGRVLFRGTLSHDGCRREIV